MTSKSSSHNAFSFTFKRLFKPCLIISAVPVGFMFVITLINAIDNLVKYGSMKYPFGGVEKGCFDFNSIIMSTEILYAVLILVSCLYGLIAFRFLTNKKECNVYLSLGISKNKLFWSRYLGAGSALAILTVGFCLFDFLNGYINGTGALNKPEAILWLLSTLYLLCASMCAYSVTVLSFVNAGNIVEGTVFTFLFGIFPTIFTSCSEMAYGNLTFGSAYGSAAYGATSDFYNKNWFLDIFGSLSEREIQRQFSQSGPIKDFVMPDLAGIFVCLAAFVLIAVLASLMFKKRTSENSGTVFKSFNLYRITFVLAGILMFTVMTGVDIGNRYLVADIAILAAVIVCIVGTLIFTRKIPTKTAVSLAASLGVFCLICFIGYGSAVPEISDINTVDVLINPELSPYCTASSSYNFPDAATVGTNYSYGSYSTLKSADDIKWITDIHKELTEFGYHSKCDDNSANATIVIKYNLKNGKSVAKRYYFETAETYKKMLGFMKTDKGEEYLEKLFDYSKTANTAGDDDATFYYNVSKSKMFDLMIDSSDIPSADEDVNSALLDKNNTVFVGFNDKNNLFSGCKKVDLSKDAGLRDALYKDLKNQTVEQRYFHSSSDEIGMLVINDSEDAIADAYLAAKRYMASDTSKDSYVGQTWEDIVSSTVNGDEYDDDGNPIQNVLSIDREEYRKNKEEAMRFYFAYGFCDNDSFIRHVYKAVITKDMTNTVKWLKDNGLYKENTAKVVSARGFKANAKSLSSLPLQTTFISALRNGFGKDSDSAKKYGNDVYFGGSGVVTDKKTLESLLSSSRLATAKIHDNYIVEFTFDDGSQVAKYVSRQNVTGETAAVFGERDTSEFAGYYYPSPVASDAITTMPTDFSVEIEGSVTEVNGNQIG